MTGQPGRSGGARTGAGRPPGTGGTPGAGRPPGATDVTLSPARLLTPGQKWKFAEKAVQYADQMLQVLVDIALNGESETARILAADKVIDRAMGKAPQHIDVTALHLYAHHRYDRAVLSFDFTHAENNHTAVNKPMPAQRFFIVAALAI